MKRTTLACLCSGVLAIGLIASMSLAEEPEPLTDEIAPTQSLVAISHEFAPALDGAYAGAWVMTIADTQFPVESASTPLTFLGQLDNQGGDTATSTHQVNAGNGNGYATFDRMYLIPSAVSGVLGGVGESLIVDGSGTGAMSGITGKIRVDAIYNVTEFGVERVAIEDGSVRFN